MHGIRIEMRIVEQEGFDQNQLKHELSGYLSDSGCTVKNIKIEDDYSEKGEIYRKINLPVKVLTYDVFGEKFDRFEIFGGLFEIIEKLGTFEETGIIKISDI